MNENAKMAQVRPESSESKLGELIVYIAAKCADDATFGATKLNKILYFSDFLSYRKFGKAITGATYQKLPHGPAPRAMVPVCRQMEENGSILKTRVNFHGKHQDRVMAKRDARLDIFSAQDIAIVDDVIDRLRGETAANVSRSSHTMAWRIAGMKEDIPYVSAFLSDEPATEDDMQWAKDQCPDA